MDVAGLRKLLSSLIVAAGLTAGMSASSAWAQMLEPGAQPQAPNPLTDQTMKPGKILLYDLEARFAKDVLERGAGQRHGAADRQGGHRQVGQLVTEKLPTDVDAD
jgi:hypothetical protein